MPHGNPQATEILKTGTSLTEARLRIYQERRATAEARRAALASRSRLLSGLRLATFALLVVAFFVAAQSGSNGLIWGLPLALLAIFIVLVRVHARVRNESAMVEACVRLQELRLAAAARRWHELPAPKLSRGSLPHWARELDVVGDASLLRLMSSGLTTPGRATLEDWLLSPADPAEIERRQSATAELAGKLDLLDEIQELAILSRPWPVGALKPFLEWAEGSGVAGRGRFRLSLIAARIVTATLIVAALLYGSTLLHQRWLVAALLLSVAAAVLLVPSARRAIDQAEGREEPVEAFVGMMKLIEAGSFQSEKLVALQHALRSRQQTASSALAALRRLLALAEVKYSPMLYAALQLVLLWDVHLLNSMNAWRAQHGGHAREWLAALAEFEALVALAVLAHGNPDWCFPTVAQPDGADALAGTAVAHPLLARDVRVANDVSVGPAGTFLLVTGSNMSGKSTLLRTLGINCVLAQAGAPVCAESFRMPRLVLGTSVQVQDSLEQGVSRFMAELLRLKAVIDLIRDSQSPYAPLPFYMLDEMLQGTNTAERQVGARMIISQLLHSRCIGIVTTHDLALADAEELNAAAQKVHFSEGVEERDGKVALSFEYRLRPGIATSVNALKLMRALGLGEG